MEDTAAKNRAELADIKRRLDTGAISYDQAKRLAQPVLDRINQRALEVARRWGKKSNPKKTFISAMRDSY